MWGEEMWAAARRAEGDCAEMMIWRVLDPWDGRAPRCAGHPSSFTERFLLIDPLVALASRDFGNPTLS